MFTERSIYFLALCMLLPNGIAFGAEVACTGSKNVNIVIIADAFVEESAARNFQLRETMQKRTGEWRYVRVRSTEDIQKALILKPDECIKTLIVNGLHTSWEDGTLKASVRYGEGKRMTYQPIDFDAAFSHSCKVPAEIKAGFSFTQTLMGGTQPGCDPKISKFAKGALVAFDSCNLAPETNPNLIFNRLSSILKLEDASIYANYTKGVAHPSNLLAVPCYEGSQGALIKSMRTLFQAVWPLTLAVNGAAYSLRNKGFLASVSEGHITYTPAQFQDAINSDR